MARRPFAHVYGSRRWQLARRAVLDRAGWRCERCGKAGRLEVHHKTRLRDGGAPYDPDNLEARCGPCHRRAHGQGTVGGRAAWRAWIRERVRRGLD